MNNYIKTLGLAVLCAGLAWLHLRYSADKTAALVGYFVSVFLVPVCVYIILTWLSGLLNNTPWWFHVICLIVVYIPVLLIFNVRYDS
jgi:divalent metal cation (Fe/Co/Zn/Cd) transporter